MQCKDATWFAIQEFPQMWGTVFGGSPEKDCSRLGSRLGSPCFEKLPYIHIMVT